MYLLYIARTKNKTKMLQFPIPLEEVPAKKKGQTTENFVDFYGVEYTFITGSKPIEFSISTWIPKAGVKYPFQLVKNPNPSDYTGLLDMAFNDHEPVEIVVCDSKGKIVIKGSYSINAFEDGINKFGDTTISIDCKEWRAY